MNTLFFDLELPELRALSAFRSVFTLRNGIFSELERFRIKHPEHERPFFFHPDPTMESILCSGEEMLSYRELAVHKNLPLPEQEETPLNFYSRLKNANRSEFIKTIIDSSSLSPFTLLDRIEESLTYDLELVLSFIDKNYFSTGKDYLEHNHSGKNHFPELIGDPANFYFHPSVRFFPGTIVNVEHGLVILDRDVSISPFSYLEAPLYAGVGTKLNSLKVSGSIFGQACRLGGEIENSIINDFTNKHHEGFLGHSLLGSWVNIGALATTSDLKNNYGTIRIHVPPVSYKTHSKTIEQISTGRIKFGSIIGDWVKVAIGTMMNTGTLIDAGSNVFGGTPPSYLPMLSWGYENNRRYDPERFFEDCRKIAIRRNQTLPKHFEAAVRYRIQSRG